MLFSGLLHRVSINYRADILAFKNTAQFPRRSAKDKFYVKSACLQEAWDRRKARDGLNPEQLFDAVSTLIAPNVENLQHTVVELFTGKIIFNFSGINLFFQDNIAITLYYSI